MSSRFARESPLSHKGLLSLEVRESCGFSRFQVETIGDAYMVVAGAPEKTKYHAHNICDMALDMVRSIDHLKDPSNGNHIQIRVGAWDTGRLCVCVCVCPRPSLSEGTLLFWLQGSTLGWLWQVWWDIKCHVMVCTGTQSTPHQPWRAMERSADWVCRYDDLTKSSLGFCCNCPGLSLMQEMHIQLSSATYEHLKGSHFIFERRGTITIKVRGSLINHMNYLH